LHDSKVTVEIIKEISAMRNLVESDGPLNVDEIRRALRVKWVLEGSVEKIGLFQRSLALQNYEAL
jgi:TolB-like protein